MEVVLKNLTKSFKSRNKKDAKDIVAVNNFNFTIPDGNLVALLGPSGCGKSTALNLICGLLKPNHGSIYFGDDDVTQLPAEQRGVGMVFQNYALYPHLTVLDNIIFPLQNLKGKNKLSKTEILQKATETAKLVQIDELLDRKPSELSGGQQQRVAIARALIKIPRVLLLDEPLSNLDARLRIATREEIRRIQRETKITTIFVTHDQEEAMSISDLIVVMKDGIIQQSGKPQDVYNNPVNLFVAKFLGSPQINIFDGQIKDGKLYIGNNDIFDIDININKDVYVGVRPEGFILSENGRLECDFSSVEIMGRDITIISKHKNHLSEKIRSIISSECQIDNRTETVNFDLKPSKVYIFDKNTEERISFNIK